jgi:hypothetical protein
VISAIERERGKFTLKPKSTLDNPAHPQTGMTKMRRYPAINQVSKRTLTRGLIQKKTKGQTKPITLSANEYREYSNAPGRNSAKKSWLMTDDIATTQSV